MKTKHTPGPWDRNIPPASKYPTIYAGRNTHVAMVLSTGLSQEEVEGNANLIAAAPELLATLKEVYAQLQIAVRYMQVDENGNGPDCAPVFQALINASAEITKATGESTS